jgi:hypothetical protein
MTHHDTSGESFVVMHNSSNLTGKRHDGAFAQRELWNIAVTISLTPA